MQQVLKSHLSGNYGISLVFYFRQCVTKQKKKRPELLFNIIYLLPRPLSESGKQTYENKANDQFPGFTVDSIKR